MKYEKFEQEYTEEIKQIQGLRFQHVDVPSFKIPGYSFIFNKAYSIAFAIPALVMVFGFAFYTQTQDPYKKDLALIEESNARILNQINTLDYESNI